MTWEEMMLPFFSVTVDPGVNTKRVIRTIRGKDGERGVGCGYFFIVTVFDPSAV